MIIDLYQVRRKRSSSIWIALPDISNINMIITHYKIQWLKLLTSNLIRMVLSQLERLMMLLLPQLISVVCIDS